MRTAILILLIGFNYTLLCTAQTKYATYESSYAERVYNIEVASKGNGKYTLYIQAYSLDRLISEGGLHINQNQLTGFIDNLKQAKAKYLEWLQTAKDNNVTELNKEVSLTKERIGAYFYYGSKWKFDYFVSPSFIVLFMNTEGRGQWHLLTVKTGILQDATNQYIDCDGFTLLFSSINEIDAFIETISPEKINAFLSAPKTTDLFKD